MLTRLPGVGKKTAQRLIVELKDKVEVSLTAFAGPAEAEVPANVPLPGGFWREVAEALQALGYKEAEIRPVVRDLSRRQAEGQLSVDQALRLALQRIDTFQRAR
jgi:Holliday junction DNA helicase RuvA